MNMNLLHYFDNIDMSDKLLIDTVNRHYISMLKIINDIESGQSLYDIATIYIWLTKLDKRNDIQDMMFDRYKELYFRNFNKESEIFYSDSWEPQLLWISEKLNTEWYRYSIAVFHALILCYNLWWMPNALIHSDIDINKINENVLPWENYSHSYCKLILSHFNPNEFDNNLLCSETVITYRRYKEQARYEYRLVRQPETYWVPYDSKLHWAEEEYLKQLSWTSYLIQDKINKTSWTFEYDWDINKSYTVYEKDMPF